MVSSILKPSSHAALPKKVITSEPRDAIKNYLKTEASAFL